MKTKSMIAGIALAAMVIGGFATCMQAEEIKGNKKLITKEISIDDYTAIQIGNIYGKSSGNFFKLLISPASSGRRSVYYRQGNETTLTVTTDENIFPELTFHVKDSVLKIRTKGGARISPSNLLIETSSKDLHELSVSAGVLFFLKSALETESIAVNVSAGADVEMKEPVHVRKAKFDVSSGAELDVTQLECENVSVDVSSGAGATLAGTARRADLSASSGAALNAGDLQAEDASCKASSGSDITVYATGTLKAKASSGAEISYKGTKTEISSSSGGDVHSID